MNIAFFLTPKKDVVYQKESSTMRQALERMEFHRYSAIPIIDDDGNYVGTLTEGDLLWKMKNTPDLDFNDTSKIHIKDIPRKVINRPVHINCDIEDLLQTASRQNFVPVIDDSGKFIGIIKRSDIINYCYEKLFKVKEIMKA
ncbi:MAG TPA: CBS domain-containing protein [Ruminiclostridium sp.]|jgi:CBS-domain-containing membrane protein|nr:CBS domain-containing protein [Ruminiclostridium sp.]